MTRIATLVLSGVLLGACGSPKHLGYDYGRAVTQAVTMQTDLTRPSVAAGGHPLNGVEAEAIRIQVNKESSDQESGVATVTE
jgi:hypothetical protein